MKRFAYAVLFLFVASLIGSAFASSCMAMQRGSVGVEAPTPPCCAMKAACVGGACSSSGLHTDCLSQTAWSAVVQKYDAGGLPKFVPVVVAINPSPIMSATAASPPPLVPPCRHAEIVDYSDIFARTGRLLI
jgi:hypothetical protein